MKRRGVRLALLALFLVVAAGAGVTLFQGDQRTAALRNSVREFDLASQRVQAAITETRTALQAAVVPGQGTDFWLPRATASIESARVELAALKQRSTDGSVLNDLDAASAALDQADEVRAELARLLRNDLRTQASAVVLGRGLESAASVAERVEGARLGEFSYADAELAAVRAYEVLAAGVVLALGLVLIGLLMPVVAEAASEPASSTERDSGSRRRDTAPGSLALSSPSEPRVEAPAAPPAPAPAPVTVPVSPSTDSVVASAAAGSAAVQVDRRKAPELRAAADLCTDFARLVDGQELPALLDRAARLLDATGFIVWMAEPGGQSLRPALAHGYPPNALARLPAITRHADNATAAAFRHAEMQIVRTNGMSPGAIVVPVLGPSGCIGAIAAEVRHGREASESVRALARIVAAQLSTLLGASTEAAGGGSGQSAAAEGTAARQVG